MPDLSNVEALVPSAELLTIGALSRETGIPVPTLRTWERRYGQPAPLRRPSGHRLYPVDWVERLRRVDYLLSQGHRAANVLVLPSAQLESMVAMSQSRPSSPRFEQPGEAPTDAEGSIRRLMRAVTRLERELLMGELRLDWTRLGPLRFLHEVAGPFMIEVGLAWRRGEIEVRHEHFTAACMSGLLHELRQPYDHTARGPRIVMAALPGDQHDIGLLMAALVLAMRGRRILYMGADLPIEETARTSHSQHASAVAISVSGAFDGARAAAMLAQLRALLPANVELWVGGSGAPSTTNDAVYFGNLLELDERLATAN